MLVLLVISGFLSGAETAFFSITQAQIIQLKDSNRSSDKIIYKLLSMPKRLLATLLIVINFANIAIVVTSTLLFDDFFDFSHNETLGFVIEVVVVTFLIVLVCEIMPKVFATQNAISFSRFSAFPIYIIDKIFAPFSWILTKSTALVDRLVKPQSYDISADQLSHAIELTSTSDTPDDEKKILKGIARFSDIDVLQIMKQRMDVVAFDMEESMQEIIPKIVENRYSRIPVYENTLDHVKGILFIKDLLPYTGGEFENFNWQKLLRPAYFVPESKKINDLLQEFKEKKSHLAVVIDEYGGTSGIVTLEDVLEEIVGEMNDEFDDDELTYSKLDDYNTVFEAKTLLNDVARIMQTEREKFDVPNDNVETLAGLILHLHEGLPSRNDVFIHNGIKLKIEAVDRKRIKRVKVTLPIRTKPANEE